MLSIRHYLTRRLTGREAAAVVVIVATLAGLGYLTCKFITARLLEARVSSATPKVCASIRQQRRALLGAIEAYKAHFGIYPPDHIMSRQPLVVDPVNNPLLYELAGVTFNPTNQMFELGRLEPADAKYVKEFFHCDGFKNCGEQADQVKNFLPGVNLPARQLHDDPDVFALSFPLYSEPLDPAVMYEMDASPWRYVSTSPTNNPGKFDLWIELKTKTRTVTIGNWEAAQ